MDLFLSILKSVIYGVIEGITEWLPISSTGHMILAEQVLKFGYTEDFMEMFRVVIQLGAILAVVVLYFHKLWPFCKDNGRDTGFVVAAQQRGAVGYKAVVRMQRPGGGTNRRRKLLWQW